MVRVVAVCPIEAGRIIFELSAQISSKSLMWCDFINAEV